VKKKLKLKRVILRFYQIIARETLDMNIQTQTLWLYSASELYRASDRRLSAKLVPTFADRGCCVVSATGPYGLILDFLDRSRYFFFQVAP
jgi:hypothetical protein